MALLDVADHAEAERFLDLAAEAAAASPTPLRARRLELWRALAGASAGDADRMREHFERALEMATAHGRPSARCEILARLALEAARLGAERDDEELLELAGRSALQAKELAPCSWATSPGGAQADAALAEVAVARGDLTAAAVAARAASGSIQEAMREDIYPELLLPTARAVFAAGDEGEKQMIKGLLQMLLAMTALRTADDEVRARWFQGPTGREGEACR